MPEFAIARIDAAGAQDVTSPARRLIAFACDALRYAASGSESGARRLIVAPFAGLPRADACALIAAAGERGSLLATIDGAKVPLAPEVQRAAQRFARACADLTAAYRAQGAALAHLVRVGRLSFGLDDHISARERVTLEALEGRAERFDAERGERAWDLAEALRALGELGARETGTGRRPPVAGPQLVPLAAYAPETPRAVRRRKTHYSASSLGTYAECERRWFYRYVCAAVEDKGSSASFYGSAFHWALERFHQEVTRASDAPREALAAKLDAWIGTAFEHYRSGFETNVEYDLQTRRARRTARRYLDWFLERSRAHPFSVAGTEMEAKLDIGGYEFIGYIDRLDRDDATGAVTVVDYKTGTIAESAMQYREKVAAFLDFQLPFYYWARTEAGDRVTRLALIPLKDALRDVQPVELEVVPVAAPGSRYGGGTTGTIGLDELQRAREKMRELACRLADEPIESFAVATDADVCTYCAYRVACRRRPLRSDDRFAR